MQTMISVTWQPLTLLLLLWASSCSQATECMTRCNADGIVVEGREMEEYCSISMPDNPYRNGDINEGEIVPCQIEIHSNCSSYCQIELYFSNFDLKPCGYNLTNVTDKCDIVDSCEYIILHEVGIGLNGQSLNQIKHFHGYNTKAKFQSITDKVLLEFCYRSETFSGRNIQVKYRAIDPTREVPFYAGPISVYILGLTVVLLGIAVGIIRWCPAVKKCLEPPKDVNAQPGMLPEIV